ncbi:ATP-dependent DNA helicase RecG [[Limnothrix rosea] IAM M-220]|uniref:ATP-dependent DNA helicase RecG n=1 Tax=[Limnothrix rosea] IAM M-220 TaxID=454133 RepID=UPI0009619144|nr:ATP-dependent DNA helicase RecG [[Limnothrix rosea] IAM M-220]OKH15172.1 ATP-dependent DNA helicase RecG [[Limnothrix rosea] IAM M-220]
MDAPDFLRLQKALSVEAERGFGDLQGHKYRFSEFLCLSFGEIPPARLDLDTRRRWTDFAQKFSQYSEFTPAKRRGVVAETRSFLQQVKTQLETPINEPRKVKSPHAEPVYAKVPKRASYQKQITLDQPLMYLPGIGPKRSEQLAKLGLLTVRDALFYYPREHIDYAKQVKITDLQPGETVTLVGSVVRCNIFTSPKNKKLSIFELYMRDSSGRIKLSRFYAGARFSNRGWQEKQKKMYPRGVVIAASGLVKKTKYGLTLDSPEIEVLTSDEADIKSLKIGRVLPVYPLTDGVPADLIRKVVIASMAALPQLKDPFPKVLRDDFELMKLPEAIANIHFPENPEILVHARRRLVFDEFFYLQLGFLQRRQQEKAKQTSAIFVPQGELIEKFQKLLPFQLTGAQNRVIGEIMADLRQPIPMNRLVQGDVGAGKTIVAVFAILAAIQSGYQAALMAPTEVLAEQHYRKLVNWFNQLYLPVELLTGSTKVKKRREIHAQLATGELKVLVGTHALIEDPVQFQNLGLVVIDEQHRFGVQQRGRLLAKGDAPHVLTMTATPIPRTLALTLHGDLDVSQIDELPPGRQPIDTRVIKGCDRPHAYDLIKREVAQGRQAYIIFPLVEESEKLEAKAAVEEHQRLSKQVFQSFNVGLLHGRMKSADKDLALTRFREKEDQIIVSTTVIEVGVDVPNATVMLIENAERFGLSQLHQLRGRVGRGKHQSHCLLVTSSKSNDSQNRLQVMEQSTDGFFIAEMDLRLRGPGEVLGTRQSGLPDFALASLTEDQEVLVLAREAAEQMLAQNPTLDRYPSIQKTLEAKYRKLLGADVLT